MIHSLSAVPGVVAPAATETGGAKPLGGTGDSLYGRDSFERAIDRPTKIGPIQNTNPDNNAAAGQIDPGDFKVR